MMARGTGMASDPDTRFQNIVENPPVPVVDQGLGYLRLCVQFWREC